MQVPIELTDDQVDSIMVKGLMGGYEVNLNFKDEPNHELLNTAFLVLLNYYMTESEYKGYMKTFSKDRQKYNSKKLAEAYGGL